MCLWTRPVWLGISQNLEKSADYPSVIIKLEWMGDAFVGGDYVIERPLRILFILIQKYKKPQETNY
jgi:hypothetical protein